MNRFHLIVGLAVVIIFLLTGQYMEYLHNRQLPDGQRMLYRSRHIYLLLAGLLNLVIGIYLTARQGWRRKLQIVGSLLIIFAPCLLLAGFFYEPNKGPEQTMLAPLGIFAVSLGALLHFISSLRQNDHGGGA